MEPVTQEDLSSVINLVKDPVLLALQLPGFEDERIAIVNWERDSKNDRYEFARVVARVWVHKKKEKATWENLIKALRSESVDESVLAQEVQDRFVLRRGSTTSTRSSLASSFTSSFTGSVFGSSGNADSLTLADAELVSHTKDCNKTRIMRQFSMLTTKIAKQLQSLNVSVKEARDHMDPLIDRSQNFYSRTSRCRRFNDLFRLMSGTPKYEPLWTYDHYSLVKDLVTLVDVDKDSKDEMKSLVQDYISDLNGYRVTKKLASILPYHLSQEYPELVHSGEYEQDFCKDLGKKLECRIRITNESLQYVANLWSDIQKEFTIPSLTALLYQITRGSVIITWLIQPSWACCILREILTSVPFFQDHLIMKVVLDEECIYDEQSGIADNQVICSLWLKEASLSGRIAKFQEAFSQPAVNINSTITNDGATALTIASQCGHVELVEFLLSNGADTTTQLINGQTALHLAASEGFTDVASLLHRKNSELMGILDDNDYSALMEAAAHDHVDVIRVLVSQQDDLGDTEISTLNEAFLLALMKGHTDSVEILHKRGATTLNTAEEGESPLVVAAGAGHTQVVEYFLEIDQEMNPDTLNFEEKSTALFLAIKFGHFEIVDRLLRSKEIIDSEDSDGMTPLVLAVLKQSPKLLNMLMTAGADPNLANKDGMTPLMLAAEAGQVDSVKLLVEKGAEVTLPHEMSGKTALHFASENGHTDVVELLALPEHQAVAIKDNNGKTALDLAKNSDIKTVLKREWSFWKRFLETAKKPFQSIRKYNLDSKLITACNRGDVEQVKLCLQKKANADALDLLRWTGLMRAAHNGHDEVVKLMLEHGANPDSKDISGWTALILASRKGYFKVVRHLVDHGADVSLSNWQGWTALMWAAQSIGKQNKTEEALLNRIETAKILLEKDAASVVDKRAKDQWTPLMQACQDGNTGLVELLVEKGANTELYNPKNWTPLMIATTKGRTDVVKALVERGDKGEHRNDKEGHGMSALHVACVKGRDECLRIMVEPAPGAKCQVDLEIKDKWGMTPLMMATKNGNEKCIEILVENGADVNTKSKQYAGWSPLFFAIKEGHLKIAKLLLANKASMTTKDQYEQTPLGFAFSHKKDIYQSLISFLQGKPQELKAIRATGEATTIKTSTPHTQATSLSPTLDTPIQLVQGEGTDAAPPSTAAQTEVPGATETDTTPAQLDQLIQQAKSSARSAVSTNMKDIERKHRNYMTQAMQSGRTAASAA